jgi:RHS repeat-associated protein
MNKLALYLITLLGLCLTQPMAHAMSVQWTDYGYDNNGNVTELYDGDSGEIVGQYEYDPYGNTIKAEGQAARENNIRFSTKEYDSSTGLYYYGYRYYDPVTGRWPSRDPIEENGGFNLYGFVGNNGVNEIDILGMKCGKGECCKNGKCEKDKCAAGSKLVIQGRVALAIQLRDALKKQTYGQPGGWFFDRPGDSCKVQNDSLLAELTVPQCWECSLEYGFAWHGGDHVWVQCKAYDCKRNVVDTQELDYWGKGATGNRNKYPYIKYWHPACEPPPLPPVKKFGH